MRSFAVFCAAGVFAASCFSQPVIDRLSYGQAVPFPIAPGQLVTLFVQGVNTQLTGPVRATTNPLPSTLAGVSVTYRQGLPGSDRLAPILEVRPISTCLGTPSGCGTGLAITAQMPFEMLTLCPLCGRPDILSYLLVSVNGTVSVQYAVQPLDNQIHFLTACDIVAGGAVGGASALPCAPIVTHADGSMVSAASSAKSGEELVAYAVGLGQTAPPQSDGQAPTQPAPTVTTYAIDFNYRVNALATKPLGPSFSGTPTFAYPTPLFTGATPGYTGLYQVNFIVPPLPAAGVGACAVAGTSGPYANVIQSNLTVSIGSVFSFDGIGICVAPGP